MAQTRRDVIRKSLQEQLGAKGAAVAHFLDLVDDYMHLWSTKEKLVKDINKRGVTVADRVNAAGETLTWKGNNSVKELTTVSRQMIALLKELGITTDQVGIIKGQAEAPEDVDI